MRSCLLFLGAACGLGGGLLPGASRAQTRNDREIHVRSKSEVAATRARLVRYIWNTSWQDVLTRRPGAVATDYRPAPSDALPRQLSNVKRIDRIGIQLNPASALSRAMLDGDERLAATLNHADLFVFYPAREDRHRGVIVHQGHSCVLDDGDAPYNVAATIERLVADGFTVAAARLPLFQNTAECGDGWSPKVGHNDLFRAAEGHEGALLQLFFEPLVELVNYWQQTRPALRDISMMGLSGGGWATTVYAAIDPRIRLSIPVAGTVPLYLRGSGYNHDAEQFLPPFYQIAGYPDLYVLGAVGQGRRELQILNRHDSCCFGERQHRVPGPSFSAAVAEYAGRVRDTVQQIGPGRFDLVMDETASTHQISLHALHDLIEPALLSGQ